MINDLMPSHPARFSGTPIIESEHCLEETTVPMRVHVKKDWMTDNYHKRIQKKWNKRFGFAMKPVMFMTPRGLLCHPSLAGKVRSALANQK